MHKILFIQIHHL